MTMDAGPDCGHYHSWRDDQEGQQGRGHGDQGVVEVGPKTLMFNTLFCLLHQLHHTGWINTSVRNHVIIINNLVKHIIQDWHNSCNTSSNKEKEWNKQFLWKGSGAFTCWIIEGRSIATWTNQIESCKWKTINFINRFKILQFSIYKFKFTVHAFTNLSKWATRRQRLNERFPNCNRQFETRNRHGDLWQYWE